MGNRARITTGFAVLLLLPCIIHAKSKSLDNRQINACMPTSSRMLYLAMPEATQILAIAGFRLQWHSPKDCPPGAIQVVLERDLTYKHTADAIGWSFPSEGIHAGIAFGLIESLGLETGRHMLACAIAHEIGHLLQGTTSHSTAGLMKAGWTSFDVEVIRNGQMLFERTDVELMHKGFAAWALRAMQPPDDR